MKITLKELTDRISKHFRWDIEIHDNEPNRLLIWHPIHWGADTEKDYKRQEKLIDRQDCKNQLFRGYAWYDISGYTYWMVEQREPNYVSIDVVVNRDKVTEKQAQRIIKWLEKVDENLLNGLNEYYS